MKSLSPPAPVLRALLRSLLADEYSLYIATRSAAQSSVGHTRAMLDQQTRVLDTQLERIAWLLGSWGEWTLVGRGDGVDRPDANHSAFSGPTSPRDLGARHEALLQQIHRFAARTSRFGDPSLDRLLPDLIAGHTQAAADLLAFEYPIAQAI